MTLTDTPFFAFLKDYYEKNRKEGFFQKMRDEAWDRFLQLNFLDKKSEVFRYFPLNPLYQLFLKIAPPSPVLQKEEILPHVYPECQGSYLVFINGAFVKEVSDLTNISKKVVALPLSVALDSYGSFFENRWQKAFDEEKDPFALLNQALHPEGLFFYVPPKVVLENPVQILDFSTTAETFSPSRIHLFFSPPGPNAMGLFYFRPRNS